MLVHSVLWFKCPRDLTLHHYDKDTSSNRLIRNQETKHDPEKCTKITPEMRTLLGSIEISYDPTTSTNVASID